MALSRSLSFCLLYFWLAGAATQAALFAPEWSDGQGGSFRAEPAEALGPLLLFREATGTIRTLPMHRLSAADCVRFHRSISQLPERAARWRDARGALSRELVDRLKWFRQWGAEARAFDAASVPEPELLLVLFGGPHLPLLLDDIEPFASRMERVYPGRLATVILQNIPDTSSQTIRRTGLPSFHTWLMVGMKEQREMLARMPYGNARSALALLALPPGDEGFSMALITRHGTPLLVGPCHNVLEITSFVDRASELLWRLNPDNPQTAHARHHYLSAVRPAEFARSRAEPLLLNSPFRSELLRAHEVSRVEARLEIDAAGAVTQVDLLPESAMPESLRGPVSETLGRSPVFLPAIDQGRAVPATMRYSLQLEPLSPLRSADAAWVQGEARTEVPLKTWLVLKHIRIDEKVLVAFDRVQADGSVLLKPVAASRGDGLTEKVLTNAFNSDWFEKDGAASVRPVAGQKQEVDGEKLTWKSMTARAGMVDLLEGSSYGARDYCIGYAWTEFDSAEAQEAWLGIGSDDGLKVWVNGELVNDKWISRRSRLDDDVVPLRLKKGPNQILLKIQNRTRDWSFTCRLRVRGS